MLIKCFRTIIYMVFVLIISNVAFAQEKSSTFSVTPYLGYYLPDSEQDLHNDPVYGISLGYNFTKYLGVEASGEYIVTTYDRAVPHSRSTDVFNYRLDGILNLIPDSRLVPFVFAGFGYQSINYPKTVSNRIASAADYGVGVKFFLTETIALRTDVRQIYIFEGSRRDNEFTMGLSYYFGGPKQAAVSRYEPIDEPAKTEEKVIILASEPEAEEQIKAAAAEPKMIILVFEDVHFDFNKSTLKPGAQEILKRNIRLLTENPKAQIRIAGYTSASGTEAYNQKLSERRATAVQEYLIAEGVITRDRLSTIGYGETNSAMYEAAPKQIYSKAAKANMRVLFEVIVK